jgi:hypothetical protein
MKAGLRADNLVWAVELIKTVNHQQDALRVIADAPQQLKELVLQPDHVARNLRNPPWVVTPN